MGLSIPSVPATIAALTAEEVWAYATKNLTNPAAAQDLANMLAGISPTATGRAALLDNLSDLDAPISGIPTTPELEADAFTRYADLAVALALIPTTPELEVDAFTRYGVLAAALAAIPTNPALSTILNIMEHEIEFPSNEVTQVITGSGNTTAQDIAVAIPAGASIRRVVILALVTALNDSATGPMKIDLEFQGKAAAAAWPGTTLWTQDDVIGFAAMEAATTSIVLVARPTPANALITAAGTYNFRVVITNPTAGNIRYTTQFLAVITYRMS